MKQNSVVVPKNVNDQMVEQEELGRTAVLAAINGKQVLRMAKCSTLEQAEWVCSSI